MVQYFVTGTDTGVGKTHVTAALAARARAQGQRVFAWKPVETGCELVAGARVGADQEAISSSWQEGRLRSLYRFALPASPSVAAAAEDETIDLALVEETFRLGAASADVVLVEGAGGWRVSLTDDVDMAGLACRLGLPVIVVARAGLGTINHTLLTLEAVARDEAALRAVVMSRLPSDDLAFAEQNAREIRRRTNARVVLLDADASVLDVLL